MRINLQVQSENKNGKLNTPAFLESAQIHLFFPSEVANSIIHQGFLNIHQARRSGMAADTTADDQDLQKFRTARIETEDILSGLNLSGSAESHSAEFQFLRPKSAFLVMSTPNDLISFGGYGNLIAIPSKKLRTRTTWTPGDSYSTPEDLTRGHTFQFPQEQAPEAFKYFEAQIWGTIQVQNGDIQEWWAPRDISPEVIDVLRKANLPIYFYETRFHSGKFASLNLPLHAIRAEIVPPPSNALQCILVL